MISLITSSHQRRQEHQTGLKTAWQALLLRPEIGFTRLTQDQAAWQAIETRAQQVGRPSRLVVVGIGGSSLGLQTINHAFGQNTPPLIFLESPDPHSWTKFKGWTAKDWGEAHVIVISKSGNTLETLAWCERLAAADSRAMQPATCTVIASPGEGAVQNWARKAKIPCLWIPVGVGGRFSVLTAVGMFPARLLGLSLDELRTGADWALQNVDLTTALSEEILASWQSEKWITQMWTFSEGLRLFGEWWQQLWGESLAKKLKRKGGPAPRVSTPMPCVGPRDQHSLVQQLIEGAPDKYVFINRIKTLEQDPEKFNSSLFASSPIAGRKTSLGEVLGAEAEAFTRSLAESGIPHSTLMMDSLSPRTLGALFMLWSMVIAQLSEFMDIDGFNQPGVELGKKYANQILRT